MITEPWAVGVDGFVPTQLPRLESLLAQGNGYLGVRAATDERHVEESRRTVVAPLFDRAPGPVEVSEAVALPEVTAIDVEVAGDRLACDRGALRSYRRRLRLDTGTLDTDLAWTSPSGAGVELTSRRVVSLADRHVVAARLELRSDRPVRLAVATGIDGTASNAGVQHLHELGRSCVGTTCTAHDRATQSGVEVVVRSTTTVTLDGDALAPRARSIARRSVGTRFVLDLPADTPVLVERVSTYHTTRDADAGPRPLEERSRDDHDDATARGVDQLVARSERAWRGFWERADVEVDSDDPFDQVAVRHALYHLRSMTSLDDERVGVGAKGLTGPGYQGHSFWDTEVYVLPVWLHLDPPTARRLLRYRVHQLDAARDWARQNGHRGAMVPWESAYAEDGDATPTRGGLDVRTGDREHIETGSGQLHISAVVAHAVDRYLRVTGDTTLLDGGGRELLCELARFWAGRLEGPDGNGRFHLTGVIGPDEYSIGVTDNAFTNHLAQRALAIAAEHGRDEPGVVAEGELATWRDLAERLHTPTPGPDGVIDQDTTFLSLPPLPDLDEIRDDPSLMVLDRWSLSEVSDYRVAKQADVVALLMLEAHRFDDEVHRANLATYEPLTVHDSSLSAPTHCVVAARAGEDHTAERMWRRARAVDLGPDASVAQGVHAAALGGIWQCVVLGFGGVEVTDGELSVRPNLPAGWRRLRFRLVVAGRPVVVTVAGEDVTVEPVDGG